jgi:hypothetical protein
MTLTETNASDQPLTIDANPYQFSVTRQDGTFIWDYVIGSGVPVGVQQSMTLQPGQSYSYTLTWDTTQSYGMPRPTGTLIISNDQAPPQTTASIQIVDTLSYSLTTDKSSYLLGQPVQMTLTETNTSDQPVSVDANPYQFHVTQNGTWVWSFMLASGINFGVHQTVTLQPGQSYSYTLTWDTTQSIGSAIPTGTFVVSNSAAPTQATATFQIVDTSAQTSPPASPGPQPQPSPQAPIDPVVAAPTMGQAPGASAVLVPGLSTLKVVGNSTASPTPDPAREGITVLEGPTVWRPTRSLLAWSSPTPKPDPGLRLPAVSNVRPNQPGPGKSDAVIRPLLAPDHRAPASTVAGLGKHEL